MPIWHLNWNEYANSNRWLEYKDGEIISIHKVTYITCNIFNEVFNVIAVKLE